MSSEILQEERVDISYISRKMKLGSGKSKSNKNLLGDMLRDTAEALGFDLNLIKEGEANSRYILFESDLGLIEEFYELSKSKKGKRLRCYDYAGAGGDFVERMMAIFLLLAHHAGVQEETLAAQKRLMHEATGQVVLISAIRSKTSKFDQDLSDHFFIPDDGWPEDDGMDETARQAFLEYLLSNTDADIGEVRGIYWFLRLEKENDNYQELKREGQALREMNPEEFELTKDYISKRLEFEKALRDNDEYMKHADRRMDVLEGKKNLGEKQQSKEDLRQMKKIISATACEVFELDENGAEEEDKNRKRTVSLDDEEERYCRCVMQLKQASEKFSQFRDFRQSNPVSEEDMSILEIGFWRRFGQYLVPEGIVS